MDLYHFQKSNGNSIGNGIAMICVVREFLHQYNIPFGVRSSEAIGKMLQILTEREWLESGIKAFANNCFRWLSMCLIRWPLNNTLTNQSLRVYTKNVSRVCLG